MDCNEARELFSPWLDGEMNEDERELFQFHVKQCASCCLELEQWTKISSALQELAKDELMAPLDFSAGIMQLIHQDQATISRPAHWQWTKTAKSAIAAAILLLFTTLAFNTTPLLHVADKTKAPEKVKTHYANPPKQNNSETNGSINQEIKTSNKTADPSTKDVAEPVTQPSDKPVSVAANHAAKSAPVFLNKERFFTTTMLKLKVADPSSVQGQAMNIANASGAKTELLGQQTETAQKFTILKFTVASNKADNLLSQLNSLGNQISYQEEKQELTTRFSSTLEQYRNLLDQRTKIQDKEQLAQLDQQIASLQKQLSSWDKEAQEESIVLWLEE